MAHLAIDTYALVNQLKEAGIPEPQAAAQVATITQAIDNALEQTRHEYDLDKLVTSKDLDSCIKETELKIELVRSELKRDIAETKADLVRWVVGVGVLQSVLVTRLVLKVAASI